MKAAQTAAFEFYAEEADKNPSFRKIYEPWLKFRTDIMLWHRFAETTYNNFVLNNPIKS
jgi:TRAP-type mannitol/chloroaromatic compound transport system substrate-binding protein